GLENDDNRGATNQFAVARYLGRPPITITLKIHNDILQISGSAQADSIEVHDYGSRGIGIVGDGVDFGVFPSVTSVEIQTFGGNDHVTAFLPIVEQRTFQIDLGLGDDSAIIAVQPPTESGLNTTPTRVEVHGNEGDDHLAVTVGGSEPLGGHVS